MDEWMALAGKYPLLTPEEELELGRKIQENGDNAARNKLVEHNLRLVINMAARYVNQGLDFAELVQEGNVGLIQAASKYDYNRGYRFSTYASFWIKQAICRGLGNTGRTIRIPAHVAEKLYRLRKVTAELVQELGHEPSDEELGERLGWDTKTVVGLGNIQCPVSLDATTGGECDEHTTLADMIEDESVITPDQIINRIVISQQLHDHLMNLLTGREKEVIRLRFGLGGCKSHTLEEAGDKLGVTRERTRQIEWKALVKIRNSHRGQQLRNLVLSR